MGEWIEALSPLVLPALAGIAVAAGWYGTATALGLWTFYAMFGPIEKSLAVITREIERYTGAR